MKFKTFLPCFSGFYGTIWGVSDDFAYQIKDELSELGYDVEDKDASDFYDAWDYIDFDDRESDIIKEYTEYIASVLVNMGLVQWVKLEKIVSPRQYNFRNDSANVIMFLTDTNIANIKRYLKEHWEDFQTYLKDNYTSCDGFISFHSTDPFIWYDEFMNDEHKLGSVLQFILSNEYNEIEYEGYYDNESTNTFKYFDLNKYVKDKQIKK